MPFQDRITAFKSEVRRLRMSVAASKGDTEGVELEQSEFEDQVKTLREQLQFVAPCRPLLVDISANFLVTCSEAQQIWLLDCETSSRVIRRMLALHQRWSRARPTFDKSWSRQRSVWITLSPSWPFHQSTRTGMPQLSAEKPSSKKSGSRCLKRKSSLRNLCVALTKRRPAHI